MREFTHNEAARLHERRTVWALTLFAADAALYVGCIVALVLVRYSPALTALASFMTGLATGFLFVVGHDCAHQSFTSSRELNHWLGRLAFLPAFHPFGTWELTHNRIHHRFTNQRGQDHVWEPLSSADYAALNWLGQCRYRFYRTPLGHFLYNVAEIWWKRSFFPARRSVPQFRWTREDVLDHVLVIAWMMLVPATQIVLLCLASPLTLVEARSELPNLLLFSTVVPFLFFQALLSSVTYLHHTHTGVTWRNSSDEGTWLDDQRRNTVHVVFPGPVNAVFHRIMEHTAHHLRPGIPLYKLAEAQALLDGRYEDIIIHRWSPQSHLDVLRRCKLFDAADGVWRDFSGRVTSKGRVSDCHAASRAQRAPGLSILSR